MAAMMPQLSAAEEAVVADVEPAAWVDIDGAPTTTEAEDLEQIRTYLNGIQTLRARFQQVAPNQYVSTGVMSLQKPGKLRFEYEPPSPLLVVSNGSAITLVDYDLKQVTRWPINDTPLRPLVRTNLVFDEDVELIDIERTGRWVRIGVVDPKNRDEGSMRLTFSREPFELRQWDVVDARGQITVVALDDLEKNIELDKKLWKWKDPRPVRNRRLPGKR